MLSDLYGRDNYQSHIEANREYWLYLLDEPKGWHKILVTYIRSGCMFYLIEDAPELGEQFCPLSCFLAATLVFAEFDPIKDLGDKLGDIEIAKNTCCFDTEHTIVKNWPNEREIEADELDPESELLLWTLQEVKKV